MTNKDEQKEAQSSDPIGCTGDGKVWMVALLGFLVGLLVMYLAMPAVFPPEVTVVEVPSEVEEGEEPFTLDETKVQEIGQLLSDTYLLNTGEDVPVTYLKYETEGSHAVLYYSIMGQEVPIYISKDYKYLYPSAIDYDQMASEITEAKAQYLASLSAEPEPEEHPGYPTSAEPEVYLFLMSNCPYGNQAENGIVDVVSLLEDEVAFEPVYIIYDETIWAERYNADSPECLVEDNVTYCSMHGMYELAQGIREKMIYNRYGEAKWAEYAAAVNTECFLAEQDIETCWKTVAESMEIDAVDIEDNYDAEKFTILAREKQLTFSMEQFGSPALVINGVDYSGSRTSEAYKSAICSAFESEPEDCSVELAATGTDSAGSCG